MSINAISTSPPNSKPPSRWLLWTILPLIAGVAATAAVDAAAGPSLGLVIGGLFVAAILLPPLIAAQTDFPSFFAPLFGVVVGISLIWLSLVGPARATVIQWLLLTALLASFAAAIAAITILLRYLRFAPPFAAAAVSLLTLLWLTWPVWLSTELTTHLAAWLAAVHPPLVANGLLTFTVPWTEQAIAYRTTVLNQDIPIRLPGNPLICILVHMLLAGALIAVPIIKGRSGPAALQSAR